MKKVLVVSLLLVCLFALVGCGAVEEEVNKEEIQEVEEIPKNESDEEEEIEKNTEIKKDEKSTEENEEGNQFILLPIDEFITKYNNLASLTDELKPLTDANPRDENDAQMLLQDDTYAILAIFNEDNDVIFYSIGLTREDPYEKLEGNGLHATLTVANALDLDFKKLAEEFEVALNKDAHTYFDSGHMIMFDNHKVSNKSGLGMLVQVMKFIE